MFGCRQFPVFVDANEAVMSLVPVVNSANTGKVTLDTKEIFIEVSGHDLEVCHTALRIVCASLAEIGAQIDLDFKSTIFALVLGGQELDVLRGVCVVGLADIVAADAVLDFQVANNL